MDPKPTSIDSARPGSFSATDQPTHLSPLSEEGAQFGVRLVRSFFGQKWPDSIPRRAPGSATGRHAKLPPNYSVVTVCHFGAGTDVSNLWNGTVSRVSYAGSSNSSCLLIGDHLLPGWLSNFFTRGRASAKRLPALLMAVALLLTSMASPLASFAQVQDTALADPRMFSQTGFRIDRDSLWDYFSRRGGVTAFGYPVSRDFQFEGCTTQFFQRLVM